MAINIYSPPEGTDWNLYHQDKDESHWKRLFAGAVLCEREANYHDDSDFYAIVWDEEKQTLKRVEYGSTRYWTYANSAVVDATPEVLEKAEKWLFDWARDMFEGLSQRKAASPEVNKEVVITGGKKYKGLRGKVAWKGIVRFGPGRYNQHTRLGILTDAPDGHLQKIFVDERQAEVIEPEQYEDSAEILDSKALVFARNHHWHIPFVPQGMAIL